MQIDKLVSNHFETKGNCQMKRQRWFSKLVGKIGLKWASDKHFSITHIPSKSETYPTGKFDTNGKNKI